MSRSRESPEVAVVIPLDDPRGDVVEHLRTWTRSQTLTRDSFQVVLPADGRHPDFERDVAAELAPQDEIVSVPGATLMGLYDAGARAARAPVLVLTEAHVRAEPGCLASVAAAFAADRKLDAATIRHLQSATGGISPLSKRWFARCFAAWDRAGWIRLNTTAVAITGQAYARAGGLDSRLGLFAPSLLSAHLDEQGARIAHLDDAVITHELEDEMGYSLELGGDFARGEVIVRREQDPEFCERYFGPAGIWERRHAYRAELAKAIVAALTTAIRESPHDSRWLSRELAARAPARLAGAKPRLLWERAATRVSRTVAATPNLPDSLRWRGYVAAHEGNVRAIQLEEIAGANGLPAAADPGAGRIGAERTDGVVIGAYSLEEHGGHRFRWTEPVTLIRLSLDGPVTLRLETDGLRGNPLDYLHGAYAGGRALAPELLRSDGEALEIGLDPGLARTVSDSGLVLICHPLQPSRNGSSDSRRLGMPVVGLATG